MSRPKGARNRVQRPAKIAHCVRLTAEETAALEAFGGVSRGVRWLIKQLGSDQQPVSPVDPRATPVRLDR